MSDLFSQTGTEAALSALRKDLLAPGGPRISTMRNYRFAMLAYPPVEELRVRRGIRELTAELQADGWAILPIALHTLLLDRLRREDPEMLERLVARERHLSRRGFERGLEFLREEMHELLSGPDGIAADVAHRIDDFVARNPAHAERTLVLIARAGALYPLFRSSALLKHLDGRTHNVPVVLLYPGLRTEQGLSFMGELPPDRDYRPRIYA